MSDALSDRAQAALARARRSTGWSPSTSEPRTPDLLLADIEQAKQAILDRLLHDAAAPDAGNLGVELAELAEIAAAMHRAAEAEDWTPIVDIHNVAARLRAAQSQHELTDLAATELRALGFDRLLLSQVDGDRWIPRRVLYESSDVPVPCEMCRLGEMRITRGLAEFELVQRRQALLIDGSELGGRVQAGLRDVTGSTAYVAAPVLVEGSVVGMVHADHAHQRAVTEHDSAVLGVFTACLGYALERLNLLVRLQAVVREATLSPGTVLSSTGDLLAVRQTPGGPETGSERPPRQAVMLTGREREVLGLLAQGMSNLQIANKIVVSESTVKAHVKSILRKLGATNRAEAVARFFQG